MKNKKTQRIFAWIGTLCGFATITVVMLSSMSGTASAVNLTNAEKARRNVMVKVVAQDLAKCHGNAKNEIDFSAHNSGLFNSEVYWTNKNLKVSYPKVLAGKTSTKDIESTCDELITGWNGNWLISIFGGHAGDFVGIAQGVTVPNYDTSEGILNDTENMKTYLTGVGYSKNSQSSATLNNYKCMYFHLTANGEVFKHYVTPPKSGSLNFISSETYCVSLKSDGKTIDFSKDIMTLTGNDDAGNGLDRKESSRDRLKLHFMNEPRIERLSLDDGKQYFFLIQSDAIYGDYQVEEVGVSGTRWFDEALDGYFNVVNNNDNAGCYDYVEYWSWFLAPHHHYCDITGGATEQKKLSLTFDQFVSRFASYMRNIKVEDPIDGSEYKMFSTVTPQILAADDATAKFTKGNVNSFVAYFLDDSGDEIVKNGYTMTTEEQYMFYYDHLKDYFSQGNDQWLYDRNMTGSVEVYWLNESNNSFEKKHILIDSDKTACALTNDFKWDTGCQNQHDWQYFADKLSSFTQDDLTNAFNDIQLLDQDSSDDIDDTYGKNDEEACTNATSLGWLVCPLIELMQDAVVNLYAESVEPFLQTNPQIIQNSSSGWNTFQQIANIGLIILVIIIVMSQLTGVGIDNYGIKKALPKIVVAALLINLSFIICQIAVDTSNILGSSFRGFFENQIRISELDDTYQNAGQYIKTQTASSAGMTAAAFGSGALVIGGAVASIAIGGWTVVLMAIPVVLSALFSALVAVLFFFVLLGVRQAGVVILTVLSPVAILCLALPNTKKLFDKWVKLFSGVLLVYPIAGLLMGGGSYASYILLKAGGGSSNWYDLAAMLISVIPFFIIPTILKGSFAAAGNLGAKISGVGNRVGGRLSGSARRISSNAINNNQGVRSARLQHERGRQARYAKRIVGRYGNMETSQLTDKQRLRLASAQQTLNQHIAEDAKAQAGIAPVSEKDLIEQEKLKQENANVEAIEARIARSDDYDDTEKLQARLVTAIGAGDTASVRAYQNVLSKKGESGRQAVHNAMVKAEENARANGTTVSSAARRAYASNIMNKWGDDYKNNSRSTFEYAKANTGATAGGFMNNYYASSVDSLKQEQMVKMDEGELMRYRDAMKDPSYSADKVQTLQKLAYDTLNNPRLAGGMKGTQKTILEEMAAGYTLPSQSPSPKTPAPDNSAGSGPKFETFKDASSAAAALNQEIQRQRQAEQASKSNGNNKKIILP